MAAIATDPGFEGFPPAWYYLDRQTGKLSSALPANSSMATGPKVSFSMSPRFFNAPAQALGSNANTQFLGRGKPNAYLKVQVTQDRAGDGAITPLTWSAIYPVLDGPQDDMSNKFFNDPVSGDPVQNIPLPGGTAKLSTPLTAVVGGEKHSKLGDILGKVLGLANSAAGKALFPIPAVDVALAVNVESLINLATSAFAPDTKQQYWINDTATPVRLSGPPDPNDDALLLPKGTSFLIAFQDVDGGAVRSAVERIAAQPGVTIELNRGGELDVKAADGTITNPFANLIYVSFRVVVSEG